MALFNSSKAVRMCPLFSFSSEKHDCHHANDECSLNYAVNQCHHFKVFIVSYCNCNHQESALAFFELGNIPLGPDVVEKVRQENGDLPFRPCHSCKQKK